MSISSSVYDFSTKWRLPNRRLRHARCRPCKAVFRWPARAGYLSIFESYCPRCGEKLGRTAASLINFSKNRLIDEEPVGASAAYRMRAVIEQKKISSACVSVAGCDGCETHLVCPFHHKKGAS